MNMFLILSLASMAAFSHAALEGGISSADFEGRKYLLSAKTSLTDIGDFQQNCKDVDGYLAEIDTQDEYDFIMDFLSQSVPGGRETALVGGSDQTTEGQWVGMTSQTPMTFFSWYSDYGTRGVGRDCMYLVWNSQDQGMHDWKCQDTKLRRYVCEVPEGQWAEWGEWSSCSVTCGTGTHHRSRECDNTLPTSGVCKGDSTVQEACTKSKCVNYRLYKDKKTYSAAKSFCETKQPQPGALAMPKTSAQHSAMTSAISLTQTAWIGLDCVGNGRNFRWVDNTSLGSGDWSYWGKNQPNHHKANCISLYKGLSYKWADEPCNDRNYWFICEWYTY